MTAPTSRPKEGPANSTMPRGRIVWYENLAQSAKKSIDFYTRLVGWGVDTMDSGGQPYHMFTRNGAPVAGTLDMPEEARKMGTPSHWVMYVGTPDVDASVKQAKGLGAKVYVEPRDIPGMGRFAVLGDPQGATFALWKAEMAGGPDEPLQPEVGTFSWHELATSDPDAAWTFYQKMFGWEKREGHDMGPLGMYQIWSRPGWKAGIGAVYRKAPEMPMSAWCLYIRVADLDKDVEQVKKLGGQVISGPMDVPGGRIAQCVDTNGAFFALHWMA